MEKKPDEKRSPVRAEEQEESKPVRPVTPQEEAGQSIQELDDPPQAEGDRESAER